MGKLILSLSITLFLTLQAHGDGDMNKIADEKLRIDRDLLEVEFYGFGEFCSYERIVFLKNEKKVLELKNRCGREIETRTSAVLKVNKYSALVKLGPGPKDYYIYLREEPTNYVYSTTLLRMDRAVPIPTVVFREKVDGDFRDYNNDGYVDLVKTGGHGEPTGNDRMAYDPYLVYVQSKPGGKIKFTLDEALSKKFSEESGYQWHGTQYDEKLQVNSKGEPAK